MPTTSGTILDFTLKLLNPSLSQFIQRTDSININYCVNDSADPSWTQLCSARNTDAMDFSMDFDIRDFGAAGDGLTVNTSSIQSAIDKCSVNGGTVHIFSGCYITGTIYLKNNVHLRVEAGAILKGSGNISDYSRDTFKHLYKDEEALNRCLIFSENARNIEISGAGSIDGNAGLFPIADDPVENRPMLFRFLNCTHVVMRDLYITNTPSWATAWLYCSNVLVDGVTIDSSLHGTSDCLDFDGCENVRVSNCSLIASDDCLCLQSSRKDKPCRDIAITNCSFTSKWDALRIGLLSRGNIENVTVSNCVFREIGHVGILLELCEGADMQNMVFTGIVMRDTRMPIFLAFYQQRACVDAPLEVEPMGRMRGFIFSNISCTFERVPQKCPRFVEGVSPKNSLIFISGLPGYDIENILIQNLFLETNGQGSRQDADTPNVPEFSLDYLKGWWAGVYKFDADGIILPAYGLFARHVKGLRLINAVMQTRHHDSRPAVYIDDGKNVEIADLDAENPVVNR